MKIISNDLYCNVDLWTDPGDYPNSVAGSPLPSCYECDFGGEIILEAESKDEFENIDDWLDDLIKNECEIKASLQYNYNIEGNRCVVTITDAEYTPEKPEPDFY